MSGGYTGSTGKLNQNLVQPFERKMFLIKTSILEYSNIHTPYSTVKHIKRLGVLLISYNFPESSKISALIIC